jgi:Fic family protein
MTYQNKIEQIDKLNKKIQALRPIEKKLLKEVKEYFRIGFTYSSNAIEGNTLTETETKVVLEDGLTIAGKPLKDHYEASGHSDAFDFIYSLAKKKTILEKDILNIHKLFYFRIDNENAGQYRKVPVVITGTDYVPPQSTKVPALVKKFVSNIPEMKSKLHPVVFAAKVHKEIVDIHPFVDGNGRTARLLMNLALFQSGYVITIIPPILRAEYIAFVKKAQTGKKEDSDFINFISCMVYESTKDYLRLLEQLVE